jgi:predicted ATPase
MWLKQISIENFKCFGKKQVIDIGRLTLLTGANSSGKSSLMYSILGTIQSGEFPYQFSTNGKYVNMGDFSEISFRHEEKNRISIGFTMDTGDTHKIETTWVLDPANKLPRLYQLSAVSYFYSLKLTTRGKKYSLDFEYDPKADLYLKNNRDIVKMLKGISPIVANPDGKDFYNINELLIDYENPTQINGLIVETIPLKIKDFKQYGCARFDHILQNIVHSFAGFDSKLNFISSFRLHPDRTYLEKSKSDLKVERYGEGYLDQIILWETKKAKEFKELITIMKSLSLLNDIKSKRMDGGRFEMQVKTKKTGVMASLNDVGFGISQFLPIIVADLQLPNDSNLFVAQPEIHLHPSVQSSFGAYMVQQIKKTKKNYVVETHSEYLINRIRLAIVKGELQEEDIAVYYLESKANDTQLHKIKFTKDGRILNAPEDFFKTYMIDVMEIALNAVE